MEGDKVNFPGLSHTLLLRLNRYDYAHFPPIFRASYLLNLNKTAQDAF